MADIAEDLKEAGWATWNIEFRRVGKSGGGWLEIFHDVAFASDHFIYIGKGLSALSFVFQYCRSFSWWTFGTLVINFIITND